MVRTAIISLFSGIFLAPARGLSPGDGASGVTGTALEPTPVPFQRSILARFKAPALELSVSAKDPGNARWMPLRPDDALSQAQAIYLDPEDLLSQRGYAVFKSGQTKRMEP